MMTFRFVIATIAILVASSGAFSAEQSLLKVIPTLLAKNTDLAEHGFKARHLKSEWIISYCPDNTCDIIRAPTQVREQVLGDFSLLWLYYASGYVYLKRFHEVDARPLVPTVLKRHNKNCPTEPEFAAAACVLTNMALDNKIKLAFRRSDEGATIENRKNVKDELSEARITEVQAWQIKEWQK